MDWIIVLRWLHVIGACVLLGTGAGIAFFMVMAHRTKDPAFIAGVARIVVIADWVFTAAAVIVQPITGYFLALMLSWPMTASWIVLSLALYVITGAFWLPVVWMQSRMQKLAAAAAAKNEALPDTYHRLFELWFAFGFPAFAAVLAIIWLMLARPSISLFG
jgi:uncharacterized membrane protein